MKKKVIIDRDTSAFDRSTNGIELDVLSIDDAVYLQEAIKMSGFRSASLRDCCIGDIIEIDSFNQVLKITRISGSVITACITEKKSTRLFEIKVIEIHGQIVVKEVKEIGQIKPKTTNSKPIIPTSRWYHTHMRKSKRDVFPSGQHKMRV